MPGRLRKFVNESFKRLALVLLGKSLPLVVLLEFALRILPVSSQYSQVKVRKQRYL